MVTYMRCRARKCDRGFVPREELQSLDCIGVIMGKGREQVD